MQWCSAVFCEAGPLKSQINFSFLFKIKVLIMAYID